MQLPLALRPRRALFRDAAEFRFRRPHPGRKIVFTSSLTTLAGGGVSDSSGYYLLPLLSPGLYQIRVTAKGFQAQEVQDLELTVAARIDLDFRMRPLNDVWEAGQYNSVFLPGSRPS